MFKNILQHMLSESRLYHSYCVAEQAKILADFYGEDPQKAKIAGLLHDITKELSPNQHLQIINDSDIILDCIQNSTSKLLHSISGSLYVKNNLGIDDVDIISAIRFHTTAKPNMSMLEKIIYLADFTSNDRNFPDVEYMKDLVFKSLDDTIRFALSYIIKDLVNNSSKIHPDTFMAYNYYI